MRRLLPLAIAATTLLCATSAGAVTMRDDFDLRVAAELEARDKRAANWFREADAVRDFDPARASELYARVIARLPDADHALRRRCGAELRLGHREVALPLCRKALAVTRSAENLVATAHALLGLNDAVTPSADRDEALRLAEEGARAAPEEPFALQAWGEAALDRGEYAQLGEASRRLLAIVPNSADGHLLAAYAAAARADDDLTLFEIANARRAGAPAERIRVAEARASVMGQRAYLRIGARRLASSAGVWLACLGMLWALGAIASAATMSALREERGAPRRVVTPAARALRGLYRALLWLAAAFYYVSLPLTAMGVLWLGWILGYATLVTWNPARVPLVGLQALAFGSVLWASVTSAVKSLFVRDESMMRGLWITADAQPRLFALLDEVADALEAPRVDEVRILPDATLAVVEKPLSLRSFVAFGSRRRRRTLVFGLGLLDGLRVGAFKAMLAHEFGHFRHGDTAGGDLALSVRTSMAAMLVHLIRARAARVWNPVWWFAAGYPRMYQRIARGASRFQEALADRAAVLAYGSDAFTVGLRHSVSSGVRSDLRIHAAMQRVATTGIEVENLFADDAADAIPEQYVEQLIAQAYERPASPYDSHPPLKERLSAAEAEDVADSDAEGDGDDAWTLLEDRPALETAVTDDALRTLRSRGVLPERRLHARGG